ncbi:hypothetical protein BGZ99_007482 [Dissophora globulifera]|uniref:Uncharacterized protein n=1 Tax=Dissophora globulifera TaxID=979702 RepID=A0A9P6RC18_9FUNG|nr:hypothetical protein BGZ99_007482 [Dissophora globulifera]
MASPSGAREASTLSHRASETTIADRIDDESTPLLSNNNNTKGSAEPNPTSLYVKAISDHLPWHKRPTVFWILPIFGLAWVSSGMLSSSQGQFQASFLCREYMNRHSSQNMTLQAASEGIVSLLTTTRPAAGCQIPEIEAFTAKILALVEVITGIASTLSIGYYASLSDKHGRRAIIMLAFFATFVNLCCIVIMDLYWDQIGLPLMVVAGLVNGLLGGTTLGITMSLAYAADCTDPAKRSLVFSWLHAGLYLGLAVGPFLGGSIVRASGTILTVVYIDMCISALCFVLTALFLPESLPSKQPAHVRKLYEKTDESASGATGAQPVKQERVAWHSHAIRALSFFKPNGRNTNLILLAAISFIQMLSYRGTLSVVILYTNHMFHWTEYEDGIMFSLASLVRLFTMLVVLPVLVNLHQKAYRKKKSKSDAKAGKSTNRDGSVHAGATTANQKHQHQRQDNNGYSDTDISSQALFDPNDLNIASSVQHLGDSAFTYSSDEEEEVQGHRNRQISADSTATLAPVAANAGQNGEGGSSAATTTSVRTRDETFSDIKFDTWMVRTGFAINAITYVGYGMATEGWMFTTAVSAHAACIIASPSLKSLLTNLVEPSQFGSVLGAVQVVDSIAAIFSPMVISWVYAITVKSMPEFVWYTCAAWGVICVVISFMIRQKQFRNNMDV